jgi:hypothetical protein
MTVLASANNRQTGIVTTGRSLLGFVCYRLMCVVLGVIVVMYVVTLFNVVPASKVEKFLFHCVAFILRNRESLEGSQSRQTVKYGREDRGTRNQVSLCCRRPAAI